MFAKRDHSVNICEISLFYGYALILNTVVSKTAFLIAQIEIFDRKIAQ